MSNSSTCSRSITVIDWCPHCEAMVQLIDRGDLLACPDCGYPPDVATGLTADDWEQLLAAQAEPLAEAIWQDLLTQVDQVEPEVV